MREWIGNYRLYYKIYYSYKDEWVTTFTELGKCLGCAEAAEKAVAFLQNCEDEVLPLFIRDGFGNNFKA